MKLKKRIYLLTPLLVLVCVIAAGVFMKAPAKVEAESYVVRYNGGKSYNDAQLLSDQIKNDSTLSERYEIKTFKTNLFDYNGDAYNAFSAFRFNRTGDDQNGFFAFINGNVKSTYQQVASGGKYWPELYYLYFKRPEDGKLQNNNNLRNVDDAILNNGLNAGGAYSKWGIMQSNLVNGFPVFSVGIGTGGITGIREQILFNPTKDATSMKFGNNTFFDEVKYWLNPGNVSPTYFYDKNHNGTVENGEVRYSNDNQGLNQLFNDIRENTFADVDFEFIYDKDTGRYTYNSTTNHAQYNEKTNKVELYSEPLGITNGTKSQMPIFEGDLFGDGSVINAFTNKYMNASVSTAPNSQGNYSLGTSATFVDSGLKYGYNNAQQHKYYDWHAANGYWSIYYQVTGSAIGYRLYPGSGRFSPALELYDFKVPSNTQNGDYSDNSKNSDGPNGGTETGDNFNVADNIPKDSVEYIYIKFKISDPNQLATETNKLTIILQDKKTQLYGALATAYSATPGTAKQFNAGDASAPTHLVSYTYEYSKSDFGKWIELRIPVNSSDFATDFGANIEQVVIMPYYDTATTSAYDSSKYITFELSGFGFGFKGNMSNPKEPVQMATGSFLPFHKIQNSYDGENQGDSRKWNDSDGGSLYNSSLNTARRSVSNLYYDDGLTGVGRNDYGGTAAHFGMGMEVDFFMPLGKQVSVNGQKEDIIFEFSGDDDLWVYIDNKLVLDLGGRHTPVSGKINFTTGEVTYNREVYKVLKLGTNNTGNETEKLYEAGHIENNTFLNSLSAGKHTMKIFYLERAAGMSNCYISFNLPQVPEGALTVSKEIDELEGSEIKLPADFNVNGADESDKVVVFNNNGEIGFIDANGNKIDDGKGLLTYTFEAEYKVPKDYADSLYDHKYSVYKTDNPKETTVNELNLQDVKDPYTQNISETDYIVYNVRFEVPVGYTATFFLPEEAIIMRVAEVDSTQNDDNIDYRFELGKTTLDTGNGEPIIGIGNTPNNNRLTYIGEADGIKVDENTDIKLTFTNYYKAELYDLEIEKKFKDGDPVPVDQSILYTVECGKTHESDTCDNPFCNKPLLISMVIKDTKGPDGNPLPENPNKVIVKDLPKGNYKITEKADWSWRYECYNVTVQRNDAEKYGDGTIISAATSTPAP